MDASTQALHRRRQPTATEHAAVLSELQTARQQDAADRQAAPRAAPLPTLASSSEYSSMTPAPSHRLTDDTSASRARAYTWSLRLKSSTVCWVGRQHRVQVCCAAHAGAAQAVVCARCTAQAVTTPLGALHQQQQGVRWHCSQHAAPTCSPASCCASSSTTASKHLRISGWRRAAVQERVRAMATRAASQLGNDSAYNSLQPTCRCSQTAAGPTPACLLAPPKGSAPA